MKFQVNIKVCLKNNYKRKNGYNYWDIMLVLVVENIQNQKNTKMQLRDQ